MTSRQIHTFPLSDYDVRMAELGIYVDRFEILEQTLKRRAGPHRHAHYELFWLRGPARHVNDFKDYSLPGDRTSLVLISPGQVHRWKGTEAIRGTMVSFTQAFFDGAGGSGLLGDLDWSFASETGPVLTADAQLEREVTPLIARCEAEFAEHGLGWLDVVRAQLVQTLVFSQRAWQRRTKPGAAHEPSGGLMRGLRRLVEETFSTQPTVAALAKALSVTPGHLSEVAKSMTGATVRELVAQRTQLEAKRLLVHSEMSISEIAYALGYEDPSYFARSFRREAGKAPGSFREQVRLNK
jgi:AraC family transcriptional regulator, transcriptional activator of pobA